MVLDIHEIIENGANGNIDATSAAMEIAKKIGEELTDLCEEERLSEIICYCQEFTEETGNLGWLLMEIEDWCNENDIEFIQ